MRATWLLGSTGTLFVVGGSVASPFTIQPIVSQDDTQGELPLAMVYQLVTGNGGLVAIHGESDGGQYLFKNVGGYTSVLAGPSPYAGGYTAYREIAISPDAGRITVEANKTLNEFALLQIDLNTDEIIVPPVHDNTNIGESNFDSNHYQVNANGEVVYKHFTNSAQSFSVALDGTINTLVEGTSGNPAPQAPALKNFNLGTPGDGGTIAVPYRRQAITQNGSVVFYAETVGSNTSGIYRMSPTGVVTPISLGPVDVQTAVLGASNNAVLFSTVQIESEIQKVSLNLHVDGPGGGLVPLTTYNESIPKARNYAMTQQNRVAFYDPGTQDVTAGIRYYDKTFSSQVFTVMSEADEVRTATDGEGNEYVLTALSIDPNRRTAPMVNDNGVVVFDATINPVGPDDTTYEAYIAWEAATDKLQVIAKTGDAFENGVIVGFLNENTLNAVSFTGDALKDALSDDNWFFLGHRLLRRG